MSTSLQLALIAIAVGIPFGLLFMSGEWEKTARRLPPPWQPFGQRSMPAIISGTLLVKLPIGLTLFFAPPYFALNYFGFIPLRGQNHQVFFLAYLASIGTGKVIRYAYWRWKLLD